MFPPAKNTRIGQPVRRREDLRLLTGKGRFSDDVSLPGQVYMVVVRSTHAHARLVSVDVRNALASPRVLAVLTGRDLLADGLKPFPHTPFTSHPADIKMENWTAHRSTRRRSTPLPSKRCAMSAKRSR